MMQKKRFKMLVLLDLKDDGNVLKNAAILANKINGEIDLFHVKSPSSVVKHENQLSAIRTINATYSSTEEQIGSLIEPIFESYGVKINTAFAIGNVKEEISNHINTQKPNIIVLGKRKNNPFKILGDSITQFVLSTFKGTVIIASQDQTVEPDQELSLGMVNATERSLKTNLAEELLVQTDKPLMSFKIAEENSSFSLKSVVNDKKVIEYVFDHGDDVVNTVSKYLSKSKVDVLFVDQENLKKNNKENDLNIKDAIGKFNVPIIITKKANYNFQ